MEKILAKIYRSGRVTLALKIISAVCEAAIAALFLLQVGYSLYLGEYTEGAKLLVSAGVGFILVSLTRRLINAPRPYELLELYEVKPKKKKGSSFPSRHAYSSFAITVLAGLLHPLVAVCAGVLALCMCVCRVLLGIHFIRDIAAGALVGVIAGVLGILIVIL